MFVKRLLAGALAALLCFTLAACNEGAHAGSSSSTSDFQTTSETKASSAESTSASDTSEKPSAPEKPASEGIGDLEDVKIGKYVTLRYNANAVDIAYEVKKGVGSKEGVSITATPKNGYTFDGFTKDDALVNGKKPVSEKTTYEFTATGATRLFANSSFTLTYHANGGELRSGFDGTDTFSAVFFLNPSTLQENGSFIREGYTLVGYNTKEDGTGETVSLGSRVNAHGKGKLDLWCVWEKNTPADRFTCLEQEEGIAILQYHGTDETVTVPETINGKTVFAIGSQAFANNSTVKKIVIAKTVQTVKPNAFSNCSALESLVIFDQSLYHMSDTCFQNCSASLHINSVYTLTDAWFSWGAAKFDRLMWAKDKKKVIIVGGSGSIYGFDSAVLDRALAGEYEIVNLGENANITAVMYFDIIEEFVTRGDIVLWCPEAGAQSLGSDLCHARFWEHRKADYGYMQYLNIGYYSNLFSAYSQNCMELAGSKFKDFDRLSSSMSKYGDSLSNRDSKGELYSYSFKAAPSATDALSELFGNITAKGARIFFSFAAMQESGSQKVVKSQVDAYENRITALPGVVSVSEYENCIYEDKYFYDSPWHMTDEGAVIRTQRVAQDILKALGKTVE